MVAFEQDLTASADAHQLVAELSEARAGIGGARKSKHGRGEDRAVERAAEGRVVI